MLLPAGCSVFPRGIYYPSLENRLPQGALAATAEARKADLAAVAAGQALPPDAQARLRDAIARRWAGDDLARSAREMDPAAGLWVYGDAMQVVTWLYVEPVTYGELVVAGLESLRLALDVPAFRGRFPEAADDAKRAAFAEALDILALKARAADPAFAFQAADWLSITIEKNRAMLGLPAGAVVAEFLFGAMDRLDPYTRYVTPEMLRQEDMQMEGTYTGIGAEVAVRDGRLFLAHVFEGGAAAKAGLKPGDELLAVDGQPVGGPHPLDILRCLRGKAGTTVRVKIRPGGEGEPKELTLVRTMVHLPAVRDTQMVDVPRGIGYVRLGQFQGGAERELRQAVAALAKQGAKGVILDLRGNPGGSLFEAVGVASLFLAGGRVAETRGRVLGATWAYDVPLFSRPEWRGPLVVLTNEMSASAAELVAGALAARGRATVVGHRTFGKGAVQIHVPVNWGASAVCLTIARVYDPKGVCLDGRGVAPEREVAEPAAPPASIKEDPVVQAAIERLAAGESKP